MRISASPVASVTVVLFVSDALVPKERLSSLIWNVLIATGTSAPSVEVNPRFCVYTVPAIVTCAVSFVAPVPLFPSEKSPPKAPTMLQGTPFVAVQVSVLLDRSPWRRVNRSCSFSTPVKVTDHVGLEPRTTVAGRFSETALIADAGEARTTSDVAKPTTSETAPMTLRGAVDSLIVAPPDALCAER